MAVETRLNNQNLLLLPSSTNHVTGERERKRERERERERDSYFSKLKNRRQFDLIFVEIPFMPQYVDILTQNTLPNPSENIKKLYN